MGHNPEVQSCLDKNAEDKYKINLSMSNSLFKFMEGLEKAHNFARESLL